MITALKKLCFQIIILIIIFVRLNVLIDITPDKYYLLNISYLLL